VVVGVVLDEVSLGVFAAMPLPDALCGTALLAPVAFVLLEPPVDDRHKRLEL
jgi:hypothetical protein